VGGFRSGKENRIGAELVPCGAAQSARFSVEVSGCQLFLPTRQQLRHRALRACGVTGVAVGLSGGPSTAP